MYIMNESIHTNHNDVFISFIYLIYFLNVRGNLKNKKKIIEILICLQDVHDKCNIG